MRSPTGPVYAVSHAPLGESFTTREFRVSAT